MGLILDVVKNSAMGDRPALSLSRCINRNQKHLACSACMKICPKGVYDKEQKKAPKWEECQSCGLCVTACPSRCIEPSPVNIKRHLLLAEKTGDIVLSCMRAETKSGHQEACLALLPWEFMAYLALGGRLILNLKPCRDCPHEDCLELLNHQLSQLRRFLGDETYEARVKRCFDTLEEAQTGSVNRRDFFRSMMHGGQKASVLVWNDIAGTKVDAMIYRRLLARRVREMVKQEKKPSFRMQLPWLKESCFGCGICALLCPNGAIEIGEEKDGKRPVYITPHKCTGCGVCKAVCRDGSIEEICSVDVPHLDRLVLARVETRSCTQCGRAISPRKEETQCIACRQKRKK